MHACMHACMRYIAPYMCAVNRITITVGFTTREIIYIPFVEHDGYYNSLTHFLSLVVESKDVHAETL